jgi:hypothetical protein
VNTHRTILLGVAFAGLVATAILAPWGPRLAMAATCSSSNHTWAAGQPSTGTFRAGVGFGVTHPFGMYLGSGIPNCWRVTSAHIYRDPDNVVELGAFKDKTNNLYCQPPNDGDWYRFWFEIVATTKYCPSSYIHQNDGLTHRVRIYRDSSQTTDWHLYWDGAWVTLTAPVWSSGLPVGNTERLGHASSDSMYAKFDSADYMDTSGTYHNWGSLVQFPSINDDPDYSLTSTTYGFIVSKGSDDPGD